MNIPETGQITFGVCDENNNLIMFKARLVAKCYTPIYGEDYLGVFRPVAMLKSIRTIDAIAAGRGIRIHHIDVVTAFSNTPLPPIKDKEVQLELAPGCESLELGNVVKVFRALYCFKQSPSEWIKTLHEYLLS